MDTLPQDWQAHIIRAYTIFGDTSQFAPPNDLQVEQLAEFGWRDLVDALTPQMRSAFAKRRHRDAGGRFVDESVLLTAEGREIRGRMPSDKQREGAAALTKGIRNVLIRDLGRRVNMGAREEKGLPAKEKAEREKRFNDDASKHISSTSELREYAGVKQPLPKDADGHDQFNQKQRLEISKTLSDEDKQKILETADRIDKMDELFNKLIKSGADADIMMLALNFSDMDIETFSVLMRDITDRQTRKAVAKKFWDSLSDEEKEAVEAAQKRERKAKSESKEIPTGDLREVDTAEWEATHQPASDIRMEEKEREKLKRDPKDDSPAEAMAREFIGPGSTERQRARARELAAWYIETRQSWRRNGHLPNWRSLPQDDRATWYDKLDKAAKVGGIDPIDVMDSVFHPEEHDHQRRSILKSAAYQRDRAEEDRKRKNKQPA